MGYEVMHVPPISEPRSFRGIFHYLQSFSKQTEGLRMIVGARDGSVMLYEGNSALPLQAR